MIEVRPLIDAALGLTERAAAVDWRGPDPYDGLWWGWPQILVAGRRRRQVVTQLHARSPVDIRRLYRRTHPLVPKALALFGSTGLRINALTGNERARRLALDALDVLAADERAGPNAWGYHWDVQTRWSFYPAGSPRSSTFRSPSGASRGGARCRQDDLGDRARAAARWVLDNLWIEPDGFFAYHPHSRGTSTTRTSSAHGSFGRRSGMTRRSRAALRAVERTAAISGGTALGRTARVRRTSAGPILSTLATC